MRPAAQLNLPPTNISRDERPAVDRVARERDWLSLVPRALGKAGVSHKAAASDLEIDQGLLSAQLSGAPNKHFSWRRMHSLPPAFWQELVLLIIDFYDLQIGMTEIDRRDCELGRTIRQALERRLT